MATPLLSSLTSEYGETNPKRTATKVQLFFRIDDQKGWEGRSTSFCGVTVTVPDEDEDEFILKLTSTPFNDLLQQWVEVHEGRFTKTSTGADIDLTLRPKDVGVVRDLAKAIRRVTGRGQEYFNSNWKWMTKRTADSLARFAEVLKVVNNVKPEWNLFSDDY